MITQLPFVYFHDRAELEGILVRDDALSGPLPGILVIHEFTGLGDYMLPHARTLAELGYAVLLADMYGSTVRPSNKSEASAISRIYRNDRLLMRARAKAGLDSLASVRGVDKDRLFCLGFSFGGCAALELLRSGAGVRSAISFYGYLNTPIPAESNIANGRALVLHGAHDKVVPMEEIPVFEDEMKRAAIPYEIVVYPDAGHGFANATHANDPSTGSWFCERTNALAWEKVAEFLSEA